jgi:hypothetical protein
LEAFWFQAESSGVDCNLVVYTVEVRVTGSAVYPPKKVRNVSPAGIIAVSVCIGRKNGENIKRLVVVSNVIVRRLE